MATVDLRDDSTSTTVPAVQQQTMARMSKVLDFAETGRTAADVLQLFRIPKDCIMEVYVNVVTVEDSTFTFDVKTDESSPQTLISNANGEVLGVKSCDGADGDAAPIRYVIGNTACNLTLTVDHTVNAGKLQVEVLIMDLGSRAQSNYAHAST
jgi:hypothetical protein